MSKLKVYTATKIKHRDLFRKLREEWTEFHFTATWLDMKLISDFDAVECVKGWAQNEIDVAASAVTLVYAEQGDILRGALVEAGIAIGVGARVISVGDNYNYGTWRYHPKVHNVPTLLHAREWLRHYASH